MPFSELIRFAKGKTSNLSSDVSFQGDSDCCELVWDKGPIVMRNQSSKDRKGASSNNLPTFVSKPQDRKDLKNSKAKFSSIDSVLNDFPLSAPVCDMGLNEDDNTVPWLNCPVVEPFNNVYSSDILPESFGVTGNEFAHSNSTANSFRLQQGSTLKSQHTMRRPGSSELSCSEAGDATGMKLQKNNTGQPNQASGLMNFSYFSRFASGVNTRNTTTNAGAAGNENKGSALSSHNHMESTFVNSSVGFSQQESGSHAQPSNGLVESMPPKLDSILAEQSVAVCRKPDGKSEKLPDKKFGSGPSKLVVDGEKNLDPAVATSSVGSGNSLERDSNNPASSLKRKCRETGDSEGPSEEVEDESVGVRKIGLNRSGSKRSRAAEVHNLSERRRRERINEKMRALQELIPNCNKVDKASMLDEAIEYLKTLQLQILSMGTGMYMSQMMLPAAMQHMHRTHMPQFSPMGIGMGAAMGFGMSMPDMNSMMQMPSIQGTCFPVSGPPISSPSGFYGAVSSSHQGLGHLGQGLSVSNPHAPHSLFGGIPVRFPMGNVSGMPGIADVLPNSSMNPGTNQENIGLNGQPHASNVDEAQNTIGLTPSTAAN